MSEDQRYIEEQFKGVDPTGEEPSYPHTIVIRGCGGVTNHLNISYKALHGIKALMIADRDRVEYVTPAHAKLLKAINELSDALSEKRSDISGILAHIAEHGEWKDRKTYCIESRFIYCKVPSDAIKAEYDTLTTHISFEVPDPNNEGGTVWDIGEETVYVP